MCVRVCRCVNKLNRPIDDKKEKEPRKSAVLQSISKGLPQCSGESVRSDTRRISSRKRLRTNVTQDLHLTFGKNGGNQGLILNGKKW